MILILVLSFCLLYSVCGHYIYRREISCYSVYIHCVYALYFVSSGSQKEYYLLTELTAEVDISMLKFIVSDISGYYYYIIIIIMYYIPSLVPKPLQGEKLPSMLWEQE